MSQRTPRALWLPAALALCALAQIAGCTLPRSANSEIVMQNHLDQEIGQAAQRFEEGHAARAEATLDRLASLLGADGNVFATIGQRLIARGYAAQAAAFLEKQKGRTEVADDPRFWAILSEAQRESGNAARAAIAADQARQQADSLLRQAASVTPDDDNAPDTAQKMIRVGLYFVENAREIPRGIETLRHALRLAPSNPIALNALGYVLADQGTTRPEWQEALQLTREAVRREPTNPIILDSYGWALYRLGRLPEARSALREAADNAPLQHEVRYHLGVVYAALPDNESARAELQRALHLRPDFAPARQALEQLPPAAR